MKEGFAEYKYFFPNWFLPTVRPLLVGQAQELHILFPPCAPGRAVGRPRPRPRRAALFLPLVHSCGPWVMGWSAESAPLACARPAPPAGAIAVVVNDGFMNPWDVVKQRMQVWAAL